MLGRAATSGGESLIFMVGAVVERSPLGKLAKNPKRYQVSFLAGKPTGDVIRRVEEAAVPPEQVGAIGREIYAWHPKTIARSWTTVTSLLALAQES